MVSYRSDERGDDMTVNNCAMCSGVAKVRGKGPAIVRCECCGQQGEREISRLYAVQIWNRQQELIEKGRQYEALVEHARKEAIA